MLFYLLSFRLDSERTGFCFLSRFELLVFHYFYSSLKKEVSPGLRNHLTLPHTSFTLRFHTQGGGSEVDVLFLVTDNKEGHLPG